MAAPALRKALHRVVRLALYAALAVAATSMLIPFLWMVATSLKTGDQVFKPTFVPTTPFATVDGVEYRLLPQTRKWTAPGVYRVRVLHGPSRGQVLEVSTDRLVRALARRDVFTLTLDTGADTDVRLLEKVADERFEMQGVPTGQRDAAPVTLHLATDDIRQRLDPQWSNFRRAIVVSGVFLRSYLNSAIVALIVTLGQVFTSSLAAYAFARLEFPGRDRIFLAYLATMMIPGTVTMVPLFVLIKAIPEGLNYLLGTDWFTTPLWYVAGKARAYAGRPLGLDSYFALVAPGLFSAYGTFLLRQFFLTIPRDLEDAAVIDGCGRWGVYQHVILPLSKTALAALTIFTFLWIWREFMWPMVVVSSPEMQTLPVMLQAFTSVAGTDWELLMAATLLVIAPMIAVFLVAQRWFIKGIQIGALKG